MKRKRVVSRGRIKVDARRAVAKLREHLLVDPDAWPLEVIRVAAMCGATGVSIEHDADDLRISFDGRPPPAESVARLLDFALESSRDPSVRSLRLLAIALNAAISTRPRRVTVAIRDDAVGDARFSFDTTLHERGDDDAEGAERTLERTPIARAELRGAAVVIEMSKGFSWGTFVRFASQRPLREVVLLHEATRRSSLPLTFAPELPAPIASPAVLIVSLEKYGVAGGVLEVRPHAGAEPRVAFLEHGVVLADIALPASASIPIEGCGVHLPIDVHVDAESWPTNAARSQVHAQETARVIEAVHAVLPAVGRELGAAMRGAAGPLTGVVKRPTAAQAERAAAAFACCAASGSASGSASGLDDMLDLSLARDAVGRRFSARGLAALVKRAVESAGAERVFVHRGDAPLPDAFAPFAADVVWLSGSPVERLLEGAHTRDFADVHRDVAVGIQRREAWLREPATGPRIPASSTELFRLELHHASGELEGLRGEVVVHVGKREAPGVRVYVEERLLATVALDGMLPIEAAITWPQKLRPTLSFDTVVQDGNLRRALEAVSSMAAAELAAKAETLGAPAATPSARALGRAALAADPAARRGPLADAPLWPTAGGGWASLAEIRAQISDKSSTPGMSDAAPPPVAIPFVQRPPADAAHAAVPGGRTVLVLDALDTRRLTAALESEIVLVPFGPALGRVDVAQHRPVSDALEKICAETLASEGVTHSLIVTFRDGPLRGLCATASKGRLVRTYAGIALDEGPAPYDMPVVMVLEDERSMPTSTWEALLSTPTTPPMPPLLRLAETVLAILGDESPTGVVAIKHLGIGAPGPDDLRAWALEALAGAGGTAQVKSKLARVLAEVPTVPVLDERGELALEKPSMVRRAHVAKTVPYLAEAPGFPTLGWRPVIAGSRSEVAVLERALSARLEEASSECERRLGMHVLEEARKLVLGRDEEPFEGPLMGALARSPIGSSAGGDPKKTIRALVALRDGAAATPAPCALRYRGRFVCELVLSGIPPQLVVVLDTANAAHVEKWAAISNFGREAGTAAAIEAARSLVAEIISRSAHLAFEASPLGEPGACDLIVAMCNQAPSMVTRLQEASVLVESAFGTRVRLGSAWGEGPTPVARRAFPREAAGRVTQAPILLEPRHAKLEKLLQGAGLALHDITRALAEIDGDVAPARLAGAPAHPSLRARLVDLGCGDIDGELELVDADSAGIELLMMGDAVRTAAPDLPFGMRAIARPKRIDTRPKALRETTARIGEAAKLLVERLASSIDDLPKAAAAAVRASVCAAVTAGEKPTRPLREARVFTDVRDARWSLAELLRYRIRFTTDDPPYPATASATKKEPAVLRLETSFATALRNLGGRGVVDVTRELRLDAKAEARAEAPPVPAEIAPAAIAGCFAIATITEGSATGQVGLLAPAQADLAGISVHWKGRPLCALKAPPGWPVVAVVDDASLKPNRRHDGLAPTSQAEAVLERVRHHRRDLLSGLIRVPTGAWAETRVERSLPSFDVFGRVWLQGDDPASPQQMRIYWSGSGREKARRGGRITDLEDALDPLALELEAPEAVPGWLRKLPISGTLFVSPDKPHLAVDGAVRSALGMVASDALAGLLEAARDLQPNDRARWQWAAALFGVSIAAPPLRDASGTSRGTSDVIREVRRRGVVWTSRHAGVADGQFPEEAPAFVLLDDGDVPLIRLLETHAPALIRELGGPSSTPETSTPEQPRAAARPPKARRKRRRQSKEVERLLPAGDHAQADDAPVEPSPQPPPGPSWLTRVGGIVTAWTKRASPPTLEPDQPLAAAIAAAAARLGRPPPKLFVVSTGRPFAYLPKDDAVRVHVAHPAVSSLAERGEIEVLASVAIGELNRALECVTDAEELRVVSSLIEERAERRNP